jgi:hypothetical protein
MKWDDTGSAPHNSTTRHDDAYAIKQPAQTVNRREYLEAAMPTDKEAPG